ncbi:MAG: helix-turn-helix domain-containing protein, partial [Lysobacterales bacterium]
MTEQQQLLPLRPGEILALKRNERGLSLSEAAKSSGISRQVLEALESGNTDHLPGIYLKGHYRNYARFLGIEDEAFDSQIKQIDCSEAELRTIFEGKEKGSGGERWLKVSGYLAASVMIVALAWQFTHEA